MTGRDVTAAIEREYPPCLAEEWDNSGLLVGDPDREVRTIAVCLDLTDETLMMALEGGAEMVVTHQPLIFKPVSRVVAGDRVGRRILKLAANQMICYAAHTNFDVAGMAAVNAASLGLIETEPLEVTGMDEEGVPYGLGRVGVLPEAAAAGAFARTVRSVCGLDAVRLYGNEDRPVKRVAVCGGSGRSLIGAAIRSGADVFVTGDLDYHSAIDAAADDLMLIDAGHFGTEREFIRCMAETIRRAAPALSVLELPQAAPYTVIA